MVTANVMSRVFCLRAGDHLGTGFTLESDDRQYLVTAGHVVDAASPADLSYLTQTGWAAVPADAIAIDADPESDVAVISLRRDISRRLPLAPNSDGIAWGQDVYFLGFPYGLTGEHANANEGRPLPFIKKGVLSGISEGSVKVLWVDGHNNPGFSGGPLVFRGDAHPNSFKVAGVISSYRYEPEPVFDSVSATELTIRANTGIVHAIDVARALVTIQPI